MELYYAYLRLFLAFPLVIILIYACFRFLMPRLAPALGTGRRVQVVDRVALNARTFLFVIKVGSEYILIASSANGVNMLKELGQDWDGASAEEGAGLGTPERFADFTAILEEAKEKSSHSFRRFSCKNILQKFFVNQRGKSKKEANSKEDSGKRSRNLEI